MVFFLSLYALILLLPTLVLSQAQLWMGIRYLTAAEVPISDAVETELCQHPSAEVNASFRIRHPTFTHSLPLTEQLVDPCCKLDQASLLFERKKQMYIFGVPRSRSRHDPQTVALIQMRRGFAVVWRWEMGYGCPVPVLLHNVVWLRPFLHDRCRALRLREETGFKMCSFPGYSLVAGSWLRCLHNINGCGDHVPTRYMYICAKSGLRILRISLGKQPKLS